MRLSIPALVAALSILMLASPPVEADQPCLRRLPEYCMVGCDDLGAWVVQPFESQEEAFAYLVTLDPVERISAFIVQVPSATLMLRRERASKPAQKPAAGSPHWALQEYMFALDAAAEARVLGGYIFATNGGPTSYLRVWYVPCPDDSSRKRPVSR
ncbi:MAG TPA: hypothetical protein VGE86_01515 [Thermoanaerobaculia bacterium]